MIRRLLFAATILLGTISVANAQTGTWSGQLDVQGSKLTVVFHLDQENPTMDSPDQGAKGIPIKISRPGGGKIEIAIPYINASFEGIWMMKQIIGTFTQMNMSLPLTLTPGDNKPARPQTPEGPFPYTTEEVSFTNGEVILNGTLTLPEGYTEKTPALIMVTGSGQQNRDEELFEHKPFAVIADALARSGIATLRYDDRGFNGYAGNIYDCTTEDFKDDALCGIVFLRNRFDKVGVIGHSEGGTIAMMIAAEQKADFIISLAGMVISGAETLVSQNRQALASSGFPESTVTMYCDLISKAFEARINGQKMPDPEEYDIPEALKQNYMAVWAQLQMPYMLHFLSLDMRNLAGRITCPVLALNGTKDIQVECDVNLNALRDHLPYNEMNRIESVPDVNHLFQHCTTGAVTEYREIEETIAPDVLKTLTLWISGLEYN